MTLEFNSGRLPCDTSAWCRVAMVTAKGVVKEPPILSLLGFEASSFSSQARSCLFHPITSSKISKILQVSPGFEATPSHHPYHSSLGLSQFILHCCKGGRCHLLHVARTVHSDLQAAVETLPRCGVEISHWNPENRLSTVDCYG